LSARLFASRWAVVVIAGQRVQRRLQGSEQLAHLIVLLVARVVGDVAGHEHRVGRRPERTNRLNRSRKPGHELVVEPLRTDVRIAELGEEKRSGDDATSSPMRWPATKPR
jgi:hypothetical protein